MIGYNDSRIVERAKQVKFFYRIIEKDIYEYEDAYLFDFENCMAFSEGLVFLFKATEVVPGLYEQDPNTNPADLGSILREDIPRKDYAERIYKKLRKTSMYDYIVQKHFYSFDDINWGVTNV
ncbi:hypothetical protein HRF87_27090 [Bacillus sp. CRN 9]|nr:hypothetical protein [Bacillus sp. CRN 9]